LGGGGNRGGAGETEFERGMLKRKLARRGKNEGLTNGNVGKVAGKMFNYPGHPQEVWRRLIIKDSRGVGYWFVVGRGRAAVKSVLVFELLLGEEKSYSKRNSIEICQEKRDPNKTTKPIMQKKNYQAVSGKNKDIELKVVNLENNITHVPNQSKEGERAAQNPRSPTECPQNGH